MPTGATISVDESGKTLHTTAVCEQFFFVIFFTWGCVERRKKTLTKVDQATHKFSRKGIVFFIVLGLVLFYPNKIRFKN